MLQRCSSILRAPAAAAGARARSRKFPCQELIPLCCCWLRAAAGGLGAAECRAAVVTEPRLWLYHSPSKEGVGRDLWDHPDRPPLPRAGGISLCAEATLSLWGCWVREEFSPGRDRQGLSPSLAADSCPHWQRIPALTGSRSLPSQQISALLLQPRTRLCGRRRRGRSSAG